MKTTYPKIAAVLVVAGAAFPGGALRAAQFGDEIVAIVEDQVITRFDVREFAGMEEVRLRSLYSGEELRRRLFELGQAASQNLVDRELVHAEFKALEGVVPLDVLEDRIDAVVVARSGGDRLKFEEFLVRENTTFGEFRQRVRKQLAIDLLLNERVYRHRAVKPSEIAAYYGAHADELAVEAAIRVQAIRLKKEGSRYGDAAGETVREIYAKLAAGTPFGEVARAYSEGPYAEEGGDQGWNTSPSEKLRGILDGMQIGEVTKEVVDLGSSLYVLKLLDRRQAGVPPLDAALRKDIEDRLRKEKQQKRYEEFLGKLRRKYYVRTHEEFRAEAGPGE